MEIIITVEYNRKKYRLEAVHTNSFSDKAWWTVKANNKEFCLENNRPLLRKKSLEDQQWNWRMIRGECPWPFQCAMQEALEAAIKNLDQNGGRVVKM